MCALSVTMNTRSPATAAPRLAPPPATPLVRGRLKCQICRPLPASSAKHSFGAVTYMMPSTTTGVPCSEPASGTVNIHCGASRATVVLSIWSAWCSGCRPGRRCRSATPVSDVTARKRVAGAAQQVHALVVGPQLQVVEALAEHLRRRACAPSVVCTVSARERRVGGARSMVRRNSIRSASSAVG